jgi:hypothetical protein
MQLSPANPIQIVCRYIASAEIDSNLEKVIQPFRQDGRDQEFGVVINLSKPGSRYVISGF